MLNGTQIHVNAVDPNANTLNRLCRIADRFPYSVSVSVESKVFEGSDRLPYLAASRFFCARDLIARWGNRIIVLDADCLVLRTPTYPSADYGLFLRDSDELRFRVAAGIVYLTSGGLPFIDRFIDEFWARRPWKWFDDQVCLAHAHDAVRGSGMRAVRLTNRFLSFEFAPEAAIWAAKGGRKETDMRFVSTVDRLNQLISALPL